MFKDELISQDGRKVGLSGVAVAAMVAFVSACATPPANPIQDKTPAELCQDANYDPNMIVYRDESSRYRVAAVGVTGGGNLKDFGAIVGPSVITSRGGATVSGGRKTDFEARSCDQFKP